MIKEPKLRAMVILGACFLVWYMYLTLKGGQIDEKDQCFKEGMKKLTQNSATAGEQAVADLRGACYGPDAAKMLNK